MLLSSRKDHDLAKCSYVPTLSELIEACGDMFISLEQYFMAGNELLRIWNANSPMVITEGSTPEEAVAKLWLELNKK